MSVSAIGSERLRNSWFLLFVLLLVLRLAIALLVDVAFAVEKNVDVYATVAGNIVAGHGFVAVPGDPILWRTPGYPYFLALVFGLFGDGNEYAVLVAQAALVGITGLIICWIGQRLFGKPVGVVAAILFSLYPLSAYYTLRMLPEPLFTLALTATTAVLLLAVSSGRTWHYLAFGLLCGATTLIKPATMFFAVLAAVAVIVLHRRNLASVLPKVVLFVVASVLVIAPWTARNYAVTGHFIPVATGGGHALWVGNNLITGGREEVEGAELAALDEKMRAIIASAYGVDPSKIPWRSSTAPAQTVNVPYEVDQAFTREALRQMRAHPFETLGIMLRKTFRTWFSIGRIQNQWARGFVVALQGSLLALAAYGAIRAAGIGRPLLLLLLPVAYLTLIHTVTFGTLRYSMPMLPVVILLATAGIFHIVQSRWREPSPRTSLE